MKRKVEVDVGVEVVEVRSGGGGGRGGEWTCDWRWVRKDVGG